MNSKVKNYKQNLVNKGVEIISPVFSKGFELLRKTGEMIKFSVPSQIAFGAEGFASFAADFNI
jgi:hypothetical protein